MSFGLKTIIDLRSPSYVPGSEHLKLTPCFLGVLISISPASKCTSSAGRRMVQTPASVFSDLYDQRQSLSVLGEIAQECGT